MKASQLAVKLAVSPSGAALDRFCVRHFGHSPVSWVFARSEGVAYNRPLLLVTVGRKSGRDRAVVLPHFRAGGGRVAVVGSRGGMPTDPHWARNLRAHPQARVIVDRCDHRVRAHLVQGEERERLWGEIAARSPVYEVYQERAKAHREIPVFVLERVDGGALEAP